MGEEHRIYHSYSPQPKHNEFYPGRRLQTRLAKLFSKLSKILAIAGIVLIAGSFLPSVWYAIRSEGGRSVSGILIQTVTSSQERGFEVTPELSETKVEAYQPKIDPKLPKENRIKIVSAGIDTPVYEATLENYEEALKKGVWRVSNFGTPFERQRPTILAAHRFGYLRWSVPYRLKNSFYSLERLKVGDTVEITWNQRRYLYEVYREEKGEEITDYAADLILYTCESLNSPVRIFRYARLLEI